MTPEEIGNLAIAWWRADLAEQKASQEWIDAAVEKNEGKLHKVWKQASKAVGDAWDAFQTALVEFEPPEQQDIFE
ncbi:MAG: hypothetical protein KGR26_00345 [Cyanobacteria bacterium REEB65]|nr:hypothetical protein [Cyanobacteria bacterium REEB65]